MTKAPAGKDFLPDVTYEEIKTLYKQEHNAKAKLRLQACMMRKKGQTLEEISHALEYPLTTVGDWMRRIHQEGLHRVNSKRQTGRPAHLTLAQKEELENILEQSPVQQGLPYKVWTAPLLASFIGQQYHVQYKLRRIEQLVHEIGFNFLKARPEHKKANKKLQEDFKKKFLTRSDHTWNLDGRSYFLMRASYK